MTTEEVEKKQKDQEKILQKGEIARIRDQIDAQQEAANKADKSRQLKSDTKVDAARLKREQQLVMTITNLFKGREVSFYDAFKDVYDSLAAKSTITITDFKKYVKTLNLPLNIQDQRILRRIADP